ncbi:PREDICTED: uncharacterized protein LOC105443326 [Paramuricea clavata]|uniref:PREDICTED: uncharacterized protein LOC105443326 n=1 Tax=Paramuricea clavata TaxID=317549 RepID=A0A7D9M4W6_PARCT|nr:PREDICTED: uncharacterized protein LOC105443326 [Paramuricea clavata]
MPKKTRDWLLLWRNNSGRNSRAPTERGSWIEGAWHISNHDTKIIPSTKQRVASRRYHCLVDARVATKSNRYREFHPDSHYLFSRNKHRREFCTLFQSDVCIASMDDMAKIKVGAPAVSRYHQLRRLCPTMDMPNYADHDFLVPNYLLSASGYMFLEEKNVAAPILEEAGDVQVKNHFQDNAYDTTSEKSQTSVGTKNIEDAFGVNIGTGTAGNFWNNMVCQCREQLNILTTEKEICDNVLEEINHNIEFYCQKFKMEANYITEMCNNIEDQLHTCQEHLNIISSGLSSIFHCQVVQLDTLNNSSKVIEGRSCSNYESPIYFGILPEDRLVKVCPVTFKRETLEKYKDIPLIPEDIIYDGVGRAHLKTPYSGTANVYIRSHKYNATSVATHVTDLYEMLDPIREEKSVLMFLADGGPDFNPSHIANELFYYRLFRKLDADILTVMTYAARYSAFNPIEHLWAPLSNRLSGVIFSPLIDDDKTAPALQSGIDSATVKRKESTIFDRAMNDIKDKHWKDVLFDGFPVQTKIIPCNNDNLLFNDYDDVKACLKSPLRDLHQYADLIKEFNECNKHIDRHLNEIIFVKCDDSSCCNDFRSKKVKEHFQGIVKFPSPSESKEYRGRFNTFLQEEINPEKRFGDEGQHTADNADLGKCAYCPAFSFKSKTEKDRHLGMFHRRQRLNVQTTGKAFKCNYEGCGKTFESQPSLSRHQTSSKHRKRDQDQRGQKPSQKKPKMLFTIADAFRQAEGRKRREMVLEDKEDLCAADNCIIKNEDHENDVDWIECGKCGAWFHLRCVALDTMTKEEFENFNFLCVKCE